MFLNLPHGISRQFLNYHKLSRRLKRSQFLPAVENQILNLNLPGTHHISHRNLAPNPVRPGHHRRFRNRRMLLQKLLYLPVINIESALDN